ncbi:MAG: flagellar basal body rod protein FlgB [Pirellulaceae bacterium]|jgi:flagellar basal-body rod protein FlgB|nr:flagellar basal body rod protein FlgB [Pirellulaceae bacterium]MDP7015748.1 flagellar basal body rod protein FlgB [Pirellulaceae bacterium]
MFPQLFQNSTVPVLQQVIGFAQTRHEVLVGNIANINTPGYRTRDLSVEGFHEKLTAAIAERDHQNQPISEDLSASQAGDPIRQVSESLNDILYHDDTNVSIEKQVAEISKNQFMHNLAISLMSSQFSLLEAAISERV